MEIKTINENLHHIINVPEGLNTKGVYIRWDKPVVVEAGTVRIDHNLHVAKAVLQDLNHRVTLGHKRTELLAQLRTEGVKEVTMAYSGYGDSGQIENHNTTDEVADFLWDVMWTHHCGFENNDGGDGTVTWNIVEDTILIEHRDVIQDYEHTTTEL